jgi:hypothetical protein
MRRARAFATLLLAFAPVTPVWAAFARVEVLASAPSAAPSASIGATGASLPAPSLLAAPSLVAIAPSLTVAPALAPAFAAPMLAARISAEPEFPAAAPIALVQPAARSAAPLLRIVRDEAGRPSATIVLKAAAETPPADAGRLFDAAPAAPDFAALSPVRAPQAPARWAPGSILLKPVAAVVNAWNASRYQKRLDNPRLEERVTTEEHGLRESLSGVHTALTEGRFQDAIAAVTGLFMTRRASSWYMENPGYQPYRGRALDYMRFAERAVLKAYGRTHARGADAALVAEAQDAAREGRILGHAWRPTAIQERDSSLCVQNSLFNAITASVGFARPTGIEEFVAASRAALNREASLDQPASPAEIAALSQALGINLGRRDVGEGMGANSMAEWASLLGMKLAARGPPRGDAGWSGLLGPGREVLLSLRMFHPRYVHSADLAAARGHDYMILHHEVYLLGAFDSPSRGARLYLLQDSGSGRTLMATAEELDALTMETQILTTAGPVVVPQSR